MRKNGKEAPIEVEIPDSQVVFPKDMQELPIEVVQNTALIMGPSSASAKALIEAAKHPGKVRFWRTKEQIILEKIPE